MKKILPNIDRRQLRQFAVARKLQRLSEDKQRNWELAQGSNSSKHPRLNRLFGHRMDDYLTQWRIGTQQKDL